MMDWRRFSLATVIAALLVAATTVLLGGYFVYDYSQQAKQQSINLEQLSKRQVIETCVALALPVWNIDKPQIEKVIEAMAGPQSIYALRLDAAGKTYGRIRDRDWILVPWDGKVEPRGMAVYSSKVTFEEREIGVVTMYVSLDRLLRPDL